MTRPGKNVTTADTDIEQSIGKHLYQIFFCAGHKSGNNNINNGIVKVNQYLIPQRLHQNPITGQYEAPYLYVSDKLEFWMNEIADYYWQKSPTGEQVDKPVDKNDHAMDTTKYMLSHRPNVSKLTIPVHRKDVGWRSWGERDLPEEIRNHRHG